MQKTIIFFSTKGGTGKTMIAVNTAVCLAHDEGKKVALVDFDVQSIGDMSRLLDVSPERTLADLMHYMEQHKPADVHLAQFVLHSTVGVDFFQAVLRPQQTPHLRADKIKDVIGLLQKEYEYVLVDAGKAFSDSFIELLNLSNLILLVVTPDVLAVYQTKWAIDTLQYLHFPLNMIQVVLNRADALSSFSWQEVRAALPVDIVARIPSEGRVAVLGVNRSVPIVMENPKTKIALGIKHFAFELATNDRLYTAHKEVDEAAVKELGLEKAGAFWRKQNLVDPLSESVAADEHDEVLLLKRHIHNRLIEQLNIKRLDLKIFSDPKKAKELKEKAAQTVSTLLTEETGTFITSLEVRRKLVKEIVDEALGLGPLEDLLADPEVTDILVNNKDEIYVERHGKLESTTKKFISNEQVKTVIERIIAPIGRRIDESVPMVDARLPDGSRVNAIIPPLSLTGPSLAIRKFRHDAFTTRELIGLNTLTPAMTDFLKACVISRKNMIVSGGTGSGKTTVLNVLSSFIPLNERIITIEDAAELKLHQEHWIRLESRAPNIEGKGAVTIRDLFRNTLRMRPDRIIIGECRGVETLDMLQAMNTGHDGSLTTVHANSPHDVLARLDSMILMSGVELPIRAIREMIASAVDVIIHTARMSDGTRKITQITELMGMKDEVHIDLRDVFHFKQTGLEANGTVVGAFCPTGHIPTFVEEIRVKGIALPDSLFQPPA